MLFQYKRYQGTVGSDRIRNFLMGQQRPDGNTDEWNSIAPLLFYVLFQLCLGLNNKDFVRALSVRSFGPSSKGWPWISISLLLRLVDKILWAEGKRRACHLFVKQAKLTKLKYC